MLGDSTVLGAAADSSAAGGAGEGGSHEGGETSAAAAAGGPGGVGSNSGDDERGGRGEEGDRSFGGNRWPRQETLALLKIRSDMDVSFRDASVKGPLWEEVSRKLAELGYNRSAKKCKEKFENVYKYHRRTKEGRTGKPDGKAYRFFDQLEALENLPSMQSSSITPSKPQAALQATPLSVNTTVATAMASMPNTNSATPVVPHVTVPSTTTTIPMTLSQGIGNPSMNMTFSSYPPPPPQANPTNLPTSITNPTYPPLHATIPSTVFQSIPTDMLSNSSSSSTSSDEELEGRRKRKRKWKDFFERLMKEVIDKQENLQKRFLEAIEKREHDRMVREEAWRSQEMERINREREILAQERSIAAAKDAAVMSFLQKIAEQHNLGTALNNINLPQPPPPPPPPPPVQQQPIHITPPPQAHPQPFLQPQQKQAVAPTQQQLSQPVATNVVSNLELTKAGNSDQNILPASSSRWPKVEVQALIKLRRSLDAKYQENGPKGPLWEEISAAMRKLGYNRNAKRCKEKWENINKYFKKVKDSNKKRPEDSKTCPYFHLLDALYKEKHTFDNSSAADNQLKPESLMSTGAPLMVRPEQQWPPQQDMRPETEHGQGPDVSMEDLEGHHEDDDEDDEDKDGDDEDEEDEGGCNFEIVASKPASMGTAE